MTLKQTGTSYSRGPHGHCHPPTAGVAVASKVSALVKKKALEDVFRSAADIAEEVLKSEIDPDQPIDAMPAPANLAHQANRRRRGTKPPQKSKKLVR
jgi:hypothetical protein